MNTDTIADSSADDPTKALCSLSQNWWLFALRLCRCQRRLCLFQCQSARNFDHLSALNFDQVSGGYCGA